MGGPRAGGGRCPVVVVVSVRVGGGGWANRVAEDRRGPLAERLGEEVGELFADARGDGGDEQAVAVEGGGVVAGWGGSPAFPVEDVQVGAAEVGVVEVAVGGRPCG